MLTSQQNAYSVLPHIRVWLHNSTLLLTQYTPPVS